MIGVKKSHLKKETLDMISTKIGPKSRNLKLQNNFNLNNQYNIEPFLKKQKVLK
jgi:hypothetical protein